MEIDYCMPAIPMPRSFDNPRRNVTARRAGPDLARSSDTDRSRTGRSDPARRYSEDRCATARLDRRSGDGHRVVPGDHGRADRDQFLDPDTRRAVGSTDEIAWVQTAYLIAAVVMVPMCGFLSRLLSTRVLFV